MEWLFNGFLSLGIYDWAASVLQTDISKMTIAFTIAAQLHRRWVRKDVAEQFTKISASIDNVAATVSKDLYMHRERLVRIEDVVVKLDSRVTYFRIYLLLKKHLQKQIQITRGNNYV